MQMQVLLFHCFLFFFFFFFFGGLFVFESLLLDKPLSYRGGLFSVAEVQPFSQTVEQSTR
jgi:hypothetical protein